MINHPNAERGDRILFVVVAILLFLGLLMIYSASSVRGAEKFNDPARFVKLHALRIACGFFFLLVFSKMDYHRFRWITPILLLVCLVLLVGVLFRPESNGSRRWFVIAGKAFQPSEFMKLVMVFFLAAVFSQGERLEMHEKNRIAMSYLVVLLSVGLVFIEPDLGTAMVLFLVGFSMFYLGGVGWKELAKMVLVLVPLLSLGMVIFPYQRQRFLDYIGSVFGSGPMSYQVKQSIIGLAHGGFAGVGYGGGKQKLFFLPQPFSDFILSHIGEELGFLGLGAVFILLFLVLWRGVRIALRAPDRFGTLLAGGITSMILVNALINAGVVVNLLPTTGLPFPFLSYGGSSLVVHLVGIGILLNISKRNVASYPGFTIPRGRND